MMRVWTASGTQAHFSCVCAASRRRAILSPREGDWFSMRRILTNFMAECKEKKLFFWEKFRGKVREEVFFL